MARARVLFFARHPATVEALADNLCLRLYTGKALSWYRRKEPTTPTILCIFVPVVLFAELPLQINLQRSSASIQPGSSLSTAISRR